MTDPIIRMNQLAENFTARLREGKIPDIEDYAERNPELADKIREVFPTILFLEGMAGPVHSTWRGIASIHQAEELSPDQIFGAYRIDREVGRGGMGVVYEAVHIPLGKKVALKVLPIQEVREAEQLERFFREAKTAAGLHHTNIVPVFDVGQVDGTPYYAMEFIQGKGLDGILRSLASEPEEARLYAPDPFGSTAYFRWVAGLGIQAAGALDHAHQRKVIHRDIKPSNLLLDENGVLWITDFGLARREKDPSLTHIGAILGTPRYMSPEQAQSAHRPTDHRTDIYSLGATLYELTTQSPAFEGRTSKEVVSDILGREPVPPSRINPSVPRDLETIVLKAMNKRMEDRYPSAEELRDDLNRWLRMEPIVARRIGLLGRTYRWCRRNPRVASLLALVVFILCLGVLGITWQWQRAVSARIEEARARRQAEAMQIQAQSERDRARLERDAKQEALLEKERAFTLSEGLRLAAQSSALLPENPGLALLLAIESAKRYPSHFANSALFQALAASHEHKTVFHDKIVTTIDFSPDGTRLVTGSDDTTGKIIDVRSGEELALLGSHRGGIVSARFSPDGAQVVTASADGTARIWDAWTGEEMGILKVQEEWMYVNSALFSPAGDLVVTSCEDNTVRVWDSLTCEEIALFKPKEDEVESALFCRDGRRVLVFSADKYGKAWIWDFKSRETLATLRGNIYHYPNLLDEEVFSPDGRYLVLASDECAARIWDLSTFQEPISLGDHETLTNYALFGPKGERVITGHSPGNVMIWDVATAKTTILLLGEEAKVYSARFGPDGERVATLSHDPTFHDKIVRVIDAGTGVELYLLKGHRFGRHVYSVKFSPDGKWLATASDDKTVRIWDVGGGPGIFKISMPEKESFQFVFSPHGRKLATYSTEAQDPTVRIWDCLTGERVASLRGHKLPITMARFIPDGNRLVTAYRDGTVRLWDLATGKTTSEFSVYDGRILDASLTPKGLRVVSIAPFEHLKIWDGETGEVLYSLEAAAKARFNPEGNRLITVSDHNSSWQRTIRIWDMGTGKELVTSKGYDADLDPQGRKVVIRGWGGEATSIWDLSSKKMLFTMKEDIDWSMTPAFSQDGNRVVVGSKDGTARIWDAGAGKELAVLRGHEDEVKMAGFNPDGDSVMTTSHDGAIKFWDALTGALTATVRFGEGTLDSAKFSPDGGHWAISFGDGTLQILPVDPLSVAVQRKPRELTPEEKERYQVWNPGEKEAAALVDRLFDEFFFFDDVMDHLENDAALGVDVQKAALAFARMRGRSWEYSPFDLTERAYSIIFSKDESPETYQRAFRMIEGALRFDLSEDEYNFTLISLPMALYRIGRYKDALVALDELDEVYGQDFEALAIRAMIYHQLGREEEGESILGELLPLCEVKDEGLDQDAFDSDLIREAELLIFGSASPEKDG